MNLNKVLLAGRLTRDPESRELPSGQRVTTLSLATSRTFTNKEGRKEEQTEFHNIVSFGRQAEILSQHLSKGSALFVEGRLQTRSWEADGSKRYKTEIVVDNFQFVGPKPQGSSGPSASASEERHPLESEFDKPEDQVDPHEAF